MTVREQLLGISGLDLEKRLTTMGDGELNEYIKTLNTFAEEFPIREENIMNALGVKDYLSFSKNLAFIKDMLVEIHADALADDCVKQINELTKVDHERLQAYMTKFLSVLTMLSIDIQMAMLENKNVRKDKRHENKLGAENRSILAVDDSPFILGILKNILQPVYKFSCVTNGEDALRYILNHRPDLFLLDIEMPKLDGYELVKKIRAGGHTAPVIFLTGNGTKEYVIRAVRAGAVDFITKPVDKDQVLTRIAKHI